MDESVKLLFPNPFDSSQFIKRVKGSRILPILHDPFGQPGERQNPGPSPDSDRVGPCEIVSEQQRTDDNKVTGDGLTVVTRPLPKQFQPATPQTIRGKIVRSIE